MLEETLVVYVLWYVFVYECVYAQVPLIFKGTPWHCSRPRANETHILCIYCACIVHV